MKKERIFWGMTFILLGIFLVVSKLGYFPEVNVISLLLTVFLVVVIVKSLIRANFGGILFPIAFICIIYDKQLGITSITPWTVLIAALLGSIGFSMIFHKKNRWINTKYNNEDYEFEEINGEDENHIKLRTSFGGSVKYINTDKFEKADLRCSCAGIKVYFDNATMLKESAIVKIESTCSGIELYVPKTWKIQDQTNVFLGAVNEKNTKDKASVTNTLILLGNVNFSGVEIIYV